MLSKRKELIYYFLGGRVNEAYKKNYCTSYHTYSGLFFPGTLTYQEFRRRYSKELNYYRNYFSNNIKVNFFLAYVERVRSLMFDEQGFLRVSGEER